VFKGKHLLCFAFPLLLAALLDALLRAGGGPAETLAAVLPAANSESFRAYFPLLSKYLFHRAGSCGATPAVMALALGQLELAGGDILFPIDVKLDESFMDTDDFEPAGLHPPLHRVYAFLFGDVAGALQDALRDVGALLRSAFHSKMAEFGRVQLEMESLRIMEADIEAFGVPLGEDMTWRVFKAKAKLCNGTWDLGGRGGGNTSNEGSEGLGEIESADSGGDGSDALGELGVDGGGGGALPLSPLFHLEKQREPAALCTSCGGPNGTWRGCWRLRSAAASSLCACCWPRRRVFVPDGAIRLGPARCRRRTLPTSTSTTSFSERPKRNS